MNRTKRGYIFRVGGVPIKGRKSHKGYREMFEDRERSRKKSLTYREKLEEKHRRFYEDSEYHACLTDHEFVILGQLRKMQDRAEWKDSTDQYRRLCIGPTGTVERYAPLKYRTRSKEIGHPEDSTFKKRVKCLNDDGRKKLEFKRNRKKRVQAIA